MKGAKGDAAFFTVEELAARLEVVPSLVQQLIWADLAIRPAVRLRSNPLHGIPSVQLWQRSLDWGVFEYRRGKFEDTPGGWIYLDLGGASLHDQSDTLEGPGSCIGVLDTEKRSHHKAYGPIRFQGFGGGRLS